MTNSNRRLHDTLTSSVANVTGASMGTESVTDDCTKHGVSSCRREGRRQIVRAVWRARIGHPVGRWPTTCIRLQNAVCFWIKSRLAG